METIVVNVAGLLLISLIAWWFWFSKPQSRRVGGAPIEVLVDGGVYSPARLQVEAGRPVTLRFFRKDPSPCAEKVVFADLGVTEDLPVDEYHDVTLRNLEPGEYEFTCQMQMYRGTLVVSDPGR